MKLLPFILALIILFPTGCINHDQSYPSNEPNEDTALLKDDLGDPQEIDRLIRILRGGGAHERASAAFELGNHRNQRAVEALRAALKDDPYQWSRATAAIALAKIGDTSAIPALKAAIEKHESIVSSGKDPNMDQTKCLPSFYRALEKLESNATKPK